MKRSMISMVAAVSLLVVGACAPDDDQAEVQRVDEVHTPAPVMPADTMMMHDTTMMHDTMMHDTTMMRDTMPVR
jgi:hypothetical protein